MRKTDNTGRQRSILLLAACLSAMCQGICYCISVFIPDMKELFGIDGNAPYALIFSYHSIALPTGSVLVGIIEKKTGPRTAYALGALCFTLAFAVAAAGCFAGSILCVQLGFGVMTGLGSGMVQGLMLRAVNQWYAHKRGFAIGLVQSALGGSALVFAPLAEQFLRLMPVAGAFMALGTLIGLMLTAAALMLSFPEKSKTEACEADGLSWKDMVKQPRWYGLVTVYFSGCFGGLMLSSQAKLFGLEAAADWGPEKAEVLALWAVLVFGVVNSAGRFMWGAVSDRIGRMNTMLLMLTVALCASAEMVFLAENYVGFMAMLFLTGLCYGGFQGITPAVVADYFGSRHQTINLGITDYAFAAAGFLGPMAGAALGLKTGSMSGCCVCVAGIAAGVLVKSMTRNERS